VSEVLAKVREFIAKEGAMPIERVVPGASLKDLQLIQGQRCARGCHCFYKPDLMTSDDIHVSFDHDRMITVVWEDALQIDPFPMECAGRSTIRRPRPTEALRMRQQLLTVLSALRR